MAHYPTRDPIKRLRAEISVRRLRRELVEPGQPGTSATPELYWLALIAFWGAVVAAAVLLDSGHR